jgi:hypothetical protein
LTGVYTPELRICDDDLECDSMKSSKFIVVYDPSGGFATGGGSIYSPSGAFEADKIPGEIDDTSALEGVASFGFQSKYKKGKTTPEGTTSFIFTTGNMSFESTEMDWLVISGARAQYKGTGILTYTDSNGETSDTETRFMLSSQDCDIPPIGEEQPDLNDFCALVDGETAPDRFRIKIFFENGGIVYDNERGSEEDDPITTEIISGQITVHKGDDKGNKGDGKNK